MIPLSMSTTSDGIKVVLSGDSNVHSSYDQITQALNSCTGTRLEIEILEESHAIPAGSTLLQDGCCIAIPKDKLIQAFQTARVVFLTHLRNCTRKNEHILWDASAVMLLMHPENITAANTRKRLVRAQLEREGIDYRNVLKNELLWVDGYLTSHLYRHAKSPTLWGHRRWVLEQSQINNVKVNISENWETVILVAAERHPKNYHAWSHLRWLKVASAASLIPMDPREIFDMEKTISKVLDWCLRNPADTSGFAFLQCCLSILGFRDLTASVCANIFRLAISYRWTYESVWGFLRTQVTSGQVEDEEIFNGIKDVFNTHPKAKKRLNAALK